MASIKYAGIVSGIKGKLNGSVFTMTPSGGQVRNNKTGGGTKSALFAAQQSSIVGQSKSWRGLTDVQRTAWNTATVNFPKRNKFGEVRYPSGFELFTSVNTILIKQGMAVLSVPNAPRSIPDTGDFELYTPILPLYTPNYGIGFPYSSTLAKSPQFSFSNALIDSSNWCGVISMSLDIDTSLQVGEAYPRAVDLLEFVPISITDNKIVMNILSPTTYNLIWTLNGGPSTETFTTPTITIVDNAIQNIAIKTVYMDDVASKIFVNKVDVGAVMSSAMPWSVGWEATTVLVGGATGIKGFRGTINTIQICTDYSTTDQDASAMYLGLKKGGIFRHGNSTNPNVEFYNNGGYVSTSNASPVGVSPAPFTKVDAYGSVIPLILATTVNAGIDNTSISFYLSPPISSGRSVNYNRSKRISVLDFNGVDSFDISESYFQSFGIPVYNSAVTGRIQVTDTFVGQVDPPKPTKKVIKFKAGAELAKVVS